MKKLLAGLMMITTALYADTETVTWYKDGTVYDTTTCQTGGDIIVPTAPNKRGYTFAGWEVLLYDFSTFDPNISGSGYSPDSSRQIWEVTFPYGKVSGDALCSVTRGTTVTAGTPDEIEPNGRYCWCKATGYVNNTTVHYKPTSNLAWVFVYSTDNCASGCANACGYQLATNINLRRAMFGLQ